MVENKKREQSPWYAPLVIFGVGITVVGIPFLPALANYYDAKRGYLGLIAVVLLAAAGYFLLGSVVLPVIFMLLASLLVSRYTLRKNIPFYRGLVINIIGGILCAVLSLLLINLVLGGEVAVVLAQRFATSYASSAGLSLEMPSLNEMMGDSILLGKHLAESGTALELDRMGELLAQLQQIPIAQRARELETFMMMTIGTIVPCVLLLAGVLLGGISWYMPLYMLNRGKPQIVPPLCEFTIPRLFSNACIAVSLALWVAVLFGLDQVYAAFIAANGLTFMIFLVHGIALTLFLMRHWHVPGIARAILMVLTIPLVSMVYFFIGVIETLFGVRGMMARIAQIKAKGIDPGSAQALEELQRMQREQQRKDDDDQDHT